MKRGEVWWGDTPEDGSRPYLILSRDAAIPVLNRLIVAPATRTIRGIETEVEVGREDGMPQECALSMDNTTLMRKALLLERITTLGTARMAEVCAALSLATACD